MEISYKWLKQYLRPEIEMSAAGVSEALTSIGLESGGVELVESIRGGLRGIVIGKVLTCVEHPDSDHLHITTVDLGLPEGPVQIVCGAPNVAAGQTVVVATVGTTLYDGDKEFKIKKSKIRGVESLGMICAEDEIGIGTSHDGIIVLGPEAESFIGHPAAEYYHIEDDHVIEVDLTPNRIDAASHFGVARDLAAWHSVHRSAMQAVRPSVEDFRIDRPDLAGVTVDVQAPDGVTRYCGLTIRGCEVKESPEWLKERLSAIGLRPHNNIVDITNYILHAFCQPLHCFDASTLKGAHVVVRRAAEGEKFVTLDGVERTLSAADLMICDGEDAKCIAGVFGGLESGTTEKTTDIFLESACFNPTSVRRTARRLGISTDSSFRFERGVDPNGCVYALKLAAMMVKELAGGEIVGEIVDIYPEPAAPYPVELSYGQVNALIGREIPRETVDRILEALEIRVTGRKECECGDVTLSLEVPTYRFDVRRPCDVIEDILRIYGYNNIEMNSELHACISYKTATDKDDALRRLVSEQLTGAGFNEILNNSLTAEGYYEGLAEYPLGSLVHLLNPLSQELNVMRGTMLFGGLETVAHNINRRCKDLALYEFGKVYRYNAGRESAPDAGALAPYHEESRLALWLTGSTRPAGNWLRPEEEATYFDLKGAVENVLRRLGLNPGIKVLFDTEAAPEGDLFAEKQRIVLAGSGTTAGYLGRVAPALARKLDVKAPVFYCELEWDKLSKASAKVRTEFTPLPKTQAVKRDLSLLIDKTTSFAEIAKAIRDTDRKFITGVGLFDVYEDKNLPAGKKSYAVSLTIQDPEKTLQDKHIEKIMEKVIATLRSKFNAELR